MSGLVDARLYVRNPTIVLREESDGYGLLYDPDTGQVRVANLTALFVWRQCDGTHKVDQIISALRGAFEDVPADQVSSDVRAFIEEMLEAGYMGTMEN